MILLWYHNAKDIMKIAFVLPRPSVQIYGGYKMVYDYANLMSMSKDHEICVCYDCSSVGMSRNLKSGLIKKLWGQHLFRKATWRKVDDRVKEHIITDARNINDLHPDIIIATAIRTVSTCKEAEIPKKAYFIQGFENWNFSEQEVYDSYGLGWTNIAVSKWLEKIVNEHSENKCYYIPNGIDTRIFKIHVPIGDRPLHSLVMHYRPDWHKGCKYAFEAIRILQSCYKDLKVTVVGNMVEPLDIPPGCIYMHNISSVDVAEINNHATVFLCSSIEEGFGLPGLEAMACGCALVSSTFQGVLEYAVDGENALLVPVRDGEALAEAAAKVFENDELRGRLVHNGRKVADERSIEISGRAFLNVLLEA